MDKPFDLNKKEILKKAEFHLEDLKSQYYDVCNDPVMQELEKDSITNIKNLKNEVAFLIKKEEHASCVEEKLKNSQQKLE